MDKDGWNVCQHCRYWKNEEGTNKGECRRHSPQASLVITISGQGRNFRGEFPNTYAKDFCGDYSDKFDPKKKENNNERDN